MKPHRSPRPRLAVRSSCGLLVGLAALAGTAEAQTTVRAQTPTAEIGELRLLVSAQAERIHDPETALAMLTTSSTSRQTCGIVALQKDHQPVEWRSEAAWRRLKTGMSESAVVAILGRPSWIESGATHRTLHYVDTAGTAELHGCVRIVDEDWVAEVRPPVF